MGSSSRVKPCERQRALGGFLLLGVGEEELATFLSGGCKLLRHWRLLAGLILKPWASSVISCFLGRDPVARGCVWSRCPPWYVVAELADAVMRLHSCHAHSVVSLPHFPLKFYISHLNKSNFKVDLCVNLDFDMKPAGAFVSLDSESPWPGLEEWGQAAGTLAPLLS